MSGSGSETAASPLVAEVGRRTAATTTPVASDYRFAPRRQGAGVDRPISGIASLPRSGHELDDPGDFCSRGGVSGALSRCDNPSPGGIADELSSDSVEIALDE
jgi:hypothetical protein